MSEAQTMYRSKLSWVFGIIKCRAACGSYLICAIIPSLLFCFP